MDYAEVGSEDEGQAGKKLLMGRGLECKGLGDHDIVDKVLTGRTRKNVKTGVEPAIVQLQERILSQCEQDTISVNPRACDPQSR